MTDNECKAIKSVREAQKVEVIPLSVIDEIKAEFVKRYPKNYAGDLESGGISCVFSLDKVLQIIDEKVKENTDAP